MGELTLTEQEQGRLHVMNLVLEGRMEVEEAASVIGLSERQAWRILKAYREQGALALAHGNRGRQPSNAIPEELRQRVINLARTTYAGLNHTHFSEMLAEREGIMLSRSTVRNMLADEGLTSQKPDHDPGSIPQWLESILRQKSDFKESSIPPGATTIRRPTIRQQARWDAVQEARGRSLSERATARLLGMSRKTVRRYRSTVSPPVNRPRRSAKTPALTT